MNQFETIQTLGRDTVEASFKSFGAISKGAQATAVEIADYAKRSLEQGSAAVEKLVGTRTLDRAFEVQGEYLRTSYEGFVAQATRIGELATDTAKEAFAPIEGLVAKTTRTA